MVDSSQDILQGSFTKAPISYPILPQEEVGIHSDPLALTIDDEELAKIADKRIESDINFYEKKYHLYDRRVKNEVYYFGRQVAERERKGELKEYESRAQDNVLYEIQASIKPLAMSHLPDMIVIPGMDNDESKETAKDVSKVVDNDIKKRQTRKVLGIAFKHVPVYFVGVIKARWNPEIGEYGDYEFMVVHPDNIVFDHNCTTNNADNMSYVAEAMPITVQDMLMRFPEKKEEIFEVLRRKGLMVGETPTYKDLATTVKIWEIWSDWYKKKGSGEVSEILSPEDNKYEWEKISGVIWKYENVILKKMKNPDYDHEGEQKIFTYEIPGDESTKKELDVNDVIQAMVTGQMPQGLTKEQVYRNYFDMPRKPYFFMGYDQWGKQPMDETSWLEQNMHNQETLDKRQKQIDETLSDRGKHVFSEDGGLKPDDIEKMDMNDPKQDILVQGDVNKVHAFISPERPGPQEFKDLNDTRDRMYSLAGASAIRGQLQSDVATTNQIAREADFTRADDIVEDTINPAAEWMAQWALQFIKLRYTKEHLRRILGDKGLVTFVKLNHDMITDGMEVMIKASGTDKLKAQNNAQKMAELKLIDPMTFYEDMGLSDPKGRTEKLMLFMADPAGYAAKYVMDMGTTGQLVDGLLGPGAAQNLGTPQPAGVAPQPAPIPNAPPAQPTPTDTTAVPAAPPIVPMGSPRGV